MENDQSNLSVNDQVSKDDHSLLVMIRVRPMSKKEIMNNEIQIIRPDDNMIIVLDPVEQQFQQEQKQMLDVLHRSKEQRYAFDKVFTNESQEEIYRITCSHLIKPVLKGINGTVFAYGPTGTGKTYTMIGTESSLGLTVLTIKDIFETIAIDQFHVYTVAVSYVEIYNETIRDLLLNNQQSNYLELRDDPQRGVIMAGVTEFRANNIESVMELLHQGNKKRTTESTNANVTSSRSHAVFQIQIKKRSRTKNIEDESYSGKLSLIDLAGSERGTVTENRGLRLREGAKINRSLLALANCINALGEKSKKGFFVPYRDSKLTRLLKDSLGGNCRTVMIANISPAGGGFEETINTLKYANRAKNIKTKSKVNKNTVSVHVSEYRSIIEDLRGEIQQLKQQVMQHNDQQDILEEEVDLPSQKSTTKCSLCDIRLADDSVAQTIQQEIIENFHERIQLRKSLMEVEEQNAINVLEIQQRKYHQQQQGITPTINNNPQLSENKKMISTLRTNTDKNSLKKEILDLQLLENIQQAKKIRKDIYQKIQTQDKRKYLEMVIKNHVLELQNIELEINLSVQDKSIVDLKSIVEKQKIYITHIQSQQIQQSNKNSNNSNNNNNNAQNVEQSNVKDSQKNNSSVQNSNKINSSNQNNGNNNNMTEIGDVKQYEDDEFEQNEEDIQDLKNFQQMIQCERLLIEQIKEKNKGKNTKSEKNLVLKKKNTKKI